MQLQAYDNCSLLGYYAASSGNFLPTFRDNLSVTPSTWRWDRSQFCVYFEEEAWNHAVSCLQFCLWHDIYNIIFKIKQIIYVASGSAPLNPPTPMKSSGVRTWLQLTLNPLTCKIWWALNNVTRWQMGFNSAFKGLMYKVFRLSLTLILLMWRIGWAHNNARK